MYIELCILFTAYCRLQCTIVCPKIIRPMVKLQTLRVEIGWTGVLGSHRIGNQSNPCVLLRTELSKVESSVGPSIPAIGLFRCSGVRVILKVASDLGWMKFKQIFLKIQIKHYSWTYKFPYFLQNVSVRLKPEFKCVLLEGNGKVLVKHIKQPSSRNIRWTIKTLY